VDVDGIASVPGLMAKSFVVKGKRGANGILLFVDFGEVNERVCRGSLSFPATLLFCVLFEKVDLSRL